MYIGNLEQSSITSFLTSDSVLLLSSGLLDKPSITFVIKFPTFLNSFKPNPLVVAACVPNLIPEVIVIFSVSKGIPFLLQVKLALPKLISAALPVTLNGLRSTSIRWVSVPPENILKPLFLSVSDKIFAFAKTDFIYSLKLVVVLHEKQQLLLLSHASMVHLDILEKLQNLNF